MFKGILKKSDLEGGFLYLQTEDDSIRITNSEILDQNLLDTEVELEGTISQEECSLFMFGNGRTLEVLA